MTYSELQGNSYRLESLVHIAMAVCEGKRKPRAKDIARWFSAMGEGYCGMQEDPAEDVFVFNIMTPRGNFLVLEGLWEGGGFNLQHVVNTVENMPHGEGYNELRDSVYALLKLSNQVCHRANLHRYQLGSQFGSSSLPLRIRNGFPRYKNAVKFTEKDLVSLGIGIDQLGPFGFVPNRRAELIEQSISFSNLERNPVCAYNNVFYLMLPYAVSSAIRRFVFERMDASGMRKNFVRGLAEEYAETFRKTPILGGKMGANFIFQNTSGGLIAELIAEIDTGHHLHIIMKMDELFGFEKDGLSGYHPFSDDAEKYIEQRVQKVREETRMEENYKDGITLLVVCGIGRGFYFSLPEEDDDWRIMGLSAYDFQTLSWLDKFKPISLWRLNEAQQKVASSGVELVNINGLLNLVAWKDALDGHLVPHGQISDDYVGDGNLMILVDQGGIHDLRGKVFTSHDFHCLLGIDGEYTKVCKLTDSIFEEDLRKPLYVTDTFLGDGLPLAYSGDYSLWWATLEVEDKNALSTSYERWKLVCTWFPRIAATFEASFKNKMPSRLQLKLICETTFGTSHNRPQRMDLDETRLEVSYTVEHDEFLVVIRTSRKFEDAFYHPENIAERAIVEAAVSGISELLGEVEPEVQELLVSQIVQTVYARQTHAFEATKFRDFVRSALPSTPTRISNDDISTMKFDLGWQVRDRKLGGTIEGKTECIAFLNSLVVFLENELRAMLSGFNRLQLAELIVNNHEISECDRRTWRNTSAAVLALHQDKETTLAEIMDHESRLNAVFQTCRVLLEIIPHECPVSEGRLPSKFEFSKLMARVMEITTLGGWSDAIRWDAMEPRIVITPLGDVYGNHDFFDNVVEPFGRSTNQKIIERSVDKYEGLFEETTIIKEIPDSIETDFVAALECELGIPLNDIRTFNDIGENAFIKKEKAFLAIRKSELVALLFEENALSAELIEKIIDAFTLGIRDSWKTIPKGFVDTDRQPWRFRRRLSVLRKPIIELDDEADTLLLFAPGIIRDALAYSVSNFHAGDFADYQIQSKEMRKWVGRSRASREKFNKEVADKLEGLGWKTKHDLNVTELLGKGTDEKYGEIKKYGDIDVLAWSAESGRVLIMECKDLQYKKTPGEIAEQLSKFRGELYPDGKPDLLLKHLNRVDISNAHLSEISKYTDLNSFRLEGYLVFRNPVPMQYAGKTIASKTALILFNEIEKKLKP